MKSFESLPFMCIWSSDGATKNANTVLYEVVAVKLIFGRAFYFCCEYELTG